MEKNTLEKNENDYKEAIRNKYRIEKTEGKHSHYLNNPSQALLRDLCWEIFSSDPKPEDLQVYRNFFRTEFNSEENTSVKYTDKFRKVGWFYRGTKKPANISTVELAAILVDFQPRPFIKFRKNLGEEESKLIEELRNTRTSKDLSKEEKEKEKEKEEEKEEIISEETLPKSKNTLEKIREKILANFKKKLLITSFVIAAFFLIIIISASLFNKDCMVWVNDHYVERDRSDQGYCDTYYDARYFDLKKINVCDTTTFFDNNGKAKVWYIRIGNSLECFDRFAPYPEDTNKFLKPITKYMIKTYLADRPKCR